MNNSDYMKLAIGEAKKSTQPLRCGCVLVKDDKILTMSYNSQRQDNDPTAHAEIKALRVAGKESGREAIKGAIAYCSCEPCDMCKEAMRIAGISKIYFGEYLRELDKNSLIKRDVIQERLIIEDARV